MKGSQLLLRFLYLEKQNDHARGPRSIVDWCEILGKWWTEASDEVVDRLRSTPVTKTERVAVASATSFLKQARLHNWVSVQNMEKKLALSAAVMLKISKSDESGDVAVFLRGTKTRKHKLQRLQRWRSRWSVKVGCNVARSALPVTDRRHKVRRDSLCSVKNLLLPRGKLRTRVFVATPFQTPRFLFWGSNSDSHFGVTCRKRTIGNSIS